MFELVREDFRRYRGLSGKPNALRAAVWTLTEYGFLAILVYRYGRWTRTIRPWVLSVPFKIVYKVLNTFVELLFGISISTNGDIGPGFYIGHFSCIFLHCDAGRNLSIGQDVTIGYAGAGKPGFPRLGDDVYIGTGARVLGNIRIGNGVVVGANTVVVKDVPDGMRVVGAAVRMSPLKGD